MEILSSVGHMDRSTNKDPSELIFFTGSFNLTERLKGSTAFGYSFGKATLHFQDQVVQLRQGNYFSLPISTQSQIQIETADRVCLFVKQKYTGSSILCAQTEHQGRLKYIDGCSDSLLVSPPKWGEPCLNLLYFPKATNQTFHFHPSIRLGCVASGSGFAELQGSEKALRAGDVFCIEENEMHRFRTTDSEMRVIAFHPDSDFGPTDEVHPMINRTYIKK